MLGVVFVKGSVLFICKQTSAQLVCGIFGGFLWWLLWWEVAPINPLLSLIPAQLRYLYIPEREEGPGWDFLSLIPTVLVVCLEHPFPFCLPRARVGSVPVCHILKPPPHFPTLSCAPPDTSQDFLWDLTGRICQSNSCKSQQKLRGLILVCCIEKLPINISPLCFIITVKFVLCTYYLRDNRAGVPFYEAIIWFTLAP